MQRRQKVIHLMHVVHFLEIHVYIYIYNSDRFKNWLSSL